MEPQNMDEQSSKNEKKKAAGLDLEEVKLKRDPSNLRQFVIGLTSSFLGVILGISLALYVLPNLALFQRSPLGQHITDTANHSAFEAANSALSSMSKKLAALENQKIIQAESQDVPEMSVQEIVSQYKASVVTVVAKVKDSDKKSGTKNFIGTGFILNGEGMIATNHHVIEDALYISVITSEGLEIAAKELNSDADTDLAILKLSERIKLPGIVTMGNSDLMKVGEPVVAIGSPVSRKFAGTVTSGIISGKDREMLIDGTKIKYLQTDAAINEGNSGGPLFNAKGEVIGINSAKMTEDVQGIGFAIPINVLKNKLNILSKPPLYMGITAKDLSPEAYKALKINHGVVIIEVAAGSPAAKAGVKNGDIILKMGRHDISSTGQMNEVKEQYSVADKVTLRILRGTETLEISFRLAYRP
ncbi:Outer membrane stress sensor protease DegS [Clostridiaceae bacterium JG1575]|nr:Outer membrane stress sensor protease DegS [Clostridiaceae bacterium JG1575]